MRVVRASGRPVHARTPVLAVPTHAPDTYTSCVKLSCSGMTGSRHTISLYLGTLRSSTFEEKVERDRAVAGGLNRCVPKESPGSNGRPRLTSAAHC